MKKFALRTFSLTEILDIPERSLIALVGSSQAYKSFVALDWALHIAYGLPWNGHPVRRGPVVYVAAEGDTGMKRRIEAWFKYHSECNPVEADGYFKGILQSVNLVDPDSLGKLQADIKKWSPDGVSLVILDTLARSMHGDENSVEAMSLVVAAVEEIQRLHNTAVSFLHHTGHKNRDRARGSSALPGAVDVEFLLKRGKQYMTTLENKKQKDEEPAPTMALVLEKIPLPPSKLGKERSSLVLANAEVAKKWDRDATAKQDAIRAYIKKHPDAPLRQISEEVGLPLTTIQRHIGKIRRDLAEPRSEASNGGKTLRKKRP
jgi:RecA-family ATPase